MVAEPKMDVPPPPPNGLAVAVFPPKMEPPEAFPPNAEVDELPKIFPVLATVGVVTGAVPKGELVAPNTD